MIYVKSFLVGLVSLLLAAVTLAISLTLVNFLHKSPPHGDDKAVTWDENRYPREVVCERTWSAPSHLLLAKAAVAWEEIDHMHQASTRRRGHDTFGRSHTVKARTVRCTSRGWHKRRRPLPMRPRSKRHGGHRTRAWVRSSEDGG
jgi:hypothetical protein